MLQRWVLYTLFIEHLLLCSCHNSPPPIFQSGPTIFTYVIKDCAHQCARQSVQRKQLLLFISSHITATAVYSESFLEESLIFFCLRSASPSVYEYHQLCGDRQKIIPCTQRHTAHTAKQILQTRFIKVKTKFLPAQHVYHLPRIICKYPATSKEWLH